MWFQSDPTYSKCVISIASFSKTAEDHFKDNYFVFIIGKLTKMEAYFKNNSLHFFFFF